MTKSYKEQSQDRKRVREGITEPRQPSGKKRIAQPVIVQSRLLPTSWFAKWIPEWTDKWRKHGEYRNEAMANRVMEQLKRKDPDYEYRIKPKDDT